MKKRVAMMIPKSRKIKACSATKQEFQELRELIDNQVRMRDKLEDLKHSLTEPCLCALVDKELDDVHREILRLNRIQLRGSGHSYIVAPVDINSYKEDK